MKFDPKPEQKHLSLYSEIQSLATIRASDLKAAMTHWKDNADPEYKELIDVKTEEV